MSTQFETTWELYASTWKCDSATERQAIFDKVLDSDCVYTDPLAEVKGHDGLAGYMDDFHQQVPGGYFATTYFLAHHDKSIAKWQMKNGNDEVIGDGISYGEYNEEGKLVSMTGFFEVPPQ